MCKSIYNSQTKYTLGESHTKKMFNKQSRINKKFLKEYNLNTIFKDSSEKIEYLTDSVKALKAQMVLQNKAIEELTIIMKGIQNDRK